MDERARERAHLASTLALIGLEKEAMEHKRDALETMVHEMKKHVGGTYDNDLMIQEFILERARSQATGLRLAQQAPFFSRIDFTALGADSATHYIGKHGVIDSDTLDSVVVDWRSPVANLYYAGQVGPAHYEAPDGVIDGDLTLKRIFTIEHGELYAMLDVDIIAQDRLLVDALSAVTSDRLKEVVTTIQAEQNAIIRHPMRVPLIVQGVAGSGKTTIALHRIAYLLYAHADTLAPQQLMILAPNPLFLHYISAVLPDLGVEKVRQTTFELLALSLLGKQAPKLRAGERLDDLLDDPDKAEAVRAVCRGKGSLAFGEALAVFLEEREKTALAMRNIEFGPVVLMDASEMKRMFLYELKPFPWRRRMEELNKVIKNRLKQRGVARLKQAIEEACEKRAQMLRSMPDDEDRRARLRALYEKRDAHLGEVDEQLKAFVKAMPSLWPKLGAQEIYREFLQARGLAQPDAEKLGAEDLPALLLIEEKLGGLSGRPTVLHIVIDEAQDVSPLSIAVLKSLFGAGFTLVGDMGQGIYRYRGMDSWDEAIAALPDAQMKTLMTSYRSTVEIMEYANRIAVRSPYPGQVLAQPVLRHGESPREISAASLAARDKAIADAANAYRREGMHSVAILSRDEASAKALIKRLRALGLEAALLDPYGDDYRGGTLVAAATAVKGLEFDAVIVENAGAYPDGPTGTRLLYVCVTRALHAVTMVA